MAFDAGAVIGRLELGLQGWKQSVEKVKQDQQSLSGFALRHKDAIQSLGKSFTIAGGAVTAAFGVMIKKTADAGDQINDLSKRTGVGTDVLSAYKLAAEKSGTSIDGFATGLRGLANNMQGAMDKGSPQAKMFKSIGISVTDTAGRMRPLNDVMLDVSDRFAKMPDGPEKAALAMDIFSRSGMEMIPLLNLGRQGLEDEAKAAERLGLVFSKEAAAACDEFNDSVAELKGGMQGVVIQIGTALMPAVKDLIDKVTTIVSSMTAWAKEHPELTKVISGTGLALGALATGAGSFLMIAGTLAARLATLAAAFHTTAASIAATTTLYTAGLAVVGLYIGKLIELKAALDRSSDANDAFVEKNIDLSNKLYELVTAGKMTIDTYYDLWDQFEGNAAAMAVYIQQGKAGKVAQEGLVEIGKKHAAAIEEQKKKTEGFIPVLGAQVEKVKTLAEELQITTRADIQARLKKLNQALVEYNGKLTADEVRRLKDEINGLYLNLSGLADMPKPTIGKDIFDDLSKIKGAFPGISDTYEKIKGGLGDLAVNAKEKMSEVSTIIADAMREIARSIVNVFNIKGLFGLDVKAPEFDSSYYDAMTEAAEAAYEANKNLVDASLDALKESLSKEIDGIKDYYDKLVDEADKAFDHNELMIKRREEDEDIRLDRQYENQRDAMENAKLMSKSERDAIVNNANLTQKEKDKLLRTAFTTEAERKQAIKKLEIQHENDKLARERAREDARLAREEAQEVKLEAIREAGRVKEQAARDAATIKEQQFLTDLLNLEKQHEADKDAIRAAEDKARQKLADDEERRQNSLWFKVKNIFATAAEEMLTALVANLITPAKDAISGLVGKLIGNGKDSVGGALDGAGEKVKGLGTTIGEFISGIGAGIGGFISGLATGIGTAIVTLATSIATAATILAAAAPALLTVGAIAVAIYAGFQQVNALFGAISGGGGKNTDVTFWLKLISDNTQEIHDWLFINCQEKLNYFAEKLEDIKTVIIDGVRTPLNAVCDKLDWIGNNTGTIINKLGDIVKKLGGGAYEGAVLTSPQLIMTHGTPERPEYIIPEPDLKGFMASAQAGQASGKAGATEVNVTFQISAVDGDSVERITRTKIVPVLQNIFDHYGLGIPLGAVKGY